MNAKVILYLFGMEWRRLRIWLAIFWLFLLLEALPHLAADFDLLSGFAKLMARKYHHFPQDGGLRALVWSDLGQVFPKWMPFLMSMNGAASVMAVIVCSLIGMEVAPGIRLRPVRIREEVSAKVLALGLFVILPIVALVGLNLLSRGFGGMMVAHAVGRSALALAPMVGALGLFGRLCGGFWRWVGGIVGLLVLLVIAPQLGAWYVPFPQLDLWGAEDNAWRTGVVLVLVLAIAVLLKGKTRSFRPVVIAWPLLFLALMFGFYADQSAKVEARKRAGLPEVPALTVSRLTLEGTVRPPEFITGPRVLHLSGGIQVSGVPTGYFVNWTADGELISRGGDASPISTDAGMRSKLARLMVERDSRTQTLPYELEGAALRSAIAESGVALPRLPSMSPFHNRAEELQFRNALAIRDGKFVSSQPLDVEASLSGLVFRYRLAEDLPLDTVKEYSDGRSRLRVRTSLADEKRVNVDLSSLQEGDPSDRMNLNPQVVLWDPDSGSSVLLRRSGPVQSRLLSHCWFRLLRYHNVSDYPGQVYPDLASMNVRSIRVLVYVPEILGMADRKVTVAGMPVRNLPQGGSGESWGMTFSNAEARDFFERYPARRPDPETCTAEEAGKWVALVLSRVPPYDSRWSAREIACYVPRHCGMFLRFPGEVLSRSEMAEAMRQGYPEQEKGRLFEALAAEPTANRFDALYEVIRSRGWEGEAREILRRRVSQEEKPTFRMLANSLPSADRELYPRLISQLDGSHQWEFYLKVRDLPGIEPALSEAIRRNETEARERGETNPDAYAIAAGHGSREALRTILSNIESFLRGGSPLSDSRRMLSETTIISGKRGTPDHYYARLRQIGADGFEWDPFLRLWSVKNNQP